MTKYTPLEEHLEKLPRSKRSVTLHFSDIEEVIKAKLPKSALEYQEWWANQSYGSQAPAWLGAGFVVDSVDVKRKVVQFRRDSAIRTRKKNQRQAKKPKQRTIGRAIHEKLLLDAGFKKYGRWELKDERIHLVGEIPTEPGVYAHVVNGQVYYIGTATMGLKKRLYFYGRPGSTQPTNIRINGLIKKQLEAGNAVELIAALPEPTSWNGLPVDRVPGLESGLIKKYGPPWNKRGVAE